MLMAGVIKLERVSTNLLCSELIVWPLTEGSFHQPQVPHYILINYVSMGVVDYTYPALMRVYSHP